MHLQRHNVIIFIFFKHPLLYKKIMFIGFEFLRLMICFSLLGTLVSGLVKATQICKTLYVFNIISQGDQSARKSQYMFWWLGWQFGLMTKTLTKTPKSIIKLHNLCSLLFELWFECRLWPHICFDVLYLFNILKKLVGYFYI